MQNIKDVIIVGAGPVGLYFASLCEKEGIDYLILEATDYVGGQITRLYPEKEVVDLPSIPSIKSSDYIKLLVSKIDSTKIAFEQTVTDVKNGDIIEITTANSQYFCKKLVFATGLGTTTPRPLGVENESKATNIIYSVKTFDHLKDKRVAIFGGGDSALDWAKAISAISDNVHLIHRRLEFRGNPETIKDCKNLNIHLPYVPSSIKLEGNVAKSVTIKKVDEEQYIEIPVDYIFVNYGNIPFQSKFPFEMDGSFLKVNEKLEVSKNIFAIGDVASYENKTRRMAPGNLEADKVFKLII